MFILTLSSTGNVTAACRAANVPRRTVYDHREAYPEFAAIWDDSLEESLDKLEGKLWSMGAGGNTRAIELVLKARRPIFREGNNSVNVQVNNIMSPEEERQKAAETRATIDAMIGRMSDNKMIEEPDEKEPD
jgi:hypothetical protein